MRSCLLGGNRQLTISLGGGGLVKGGGFLCAISSQVTVAATISTNQMKPFILNFVPMPRSPIFSQPPKQ